MEGGGSGPTLVSVIEPTVTPGRARPGQIPREGKTANQLLADQLALLDAKLEEIELAFAEADARALVANGLFLKSHFGTPESFDRGAPRS